MQREDEREAKGKEIEEISEETTTNEMIEAKMGEGEAEEEEEFFFGSPEVSPPLSPDSLRKEEAAKQLEAAKKKAVERVNHWKKAHPFEDGRMVGVVLPGDLLFRAWVRQNATAGEVMAELQRNVAAWTAVLEDVEITPSEWGAYWEARLQLFTGRPMAQQDLLVLPPTKSIQLFSYDPIPAYGRVSSLLHQPYKFWMLVETFWCLEALHRGAPPQVDEVLSLKLHVGPAAVYDRAFLSRSKDDLQRLDPDSPIDDMKSLYLISCPVVLPPSANENQETFIGNNVHSLAIVGPSGAGKTRLAQVIKYSEREKSMEFVSIHRDKEDEHFATRFCFACQDDNTLLEKIKTDLTKLCPNLTVNICRKKNKLPEVMVTRSMHDPYPSSELSAGEASILFILYCIHKADRGALITIDEPESHLEQARSVELCRLIEERRPDVFFIYLTHQPAIAARPASRCVFVESYTPIDRFYAQFSANTSDIPCFAWRYVDKSDVSKLDLQLLSLPEVNLLHIEGSIDTDEKVYGPLLRTIFTLVPCNGNDEAKKATFQRRSDFWLNKYRAANYYALVDRDNHSPEYIKDMEKRGIFHTKMCEIENILWAPRVIGLFLEHLHLEPCTEEDDFSAFFFAKLRQQKNEFAEAEIQDQVESNAAGDTVNRNVKAIKSVYKDMIIELFTHWKRYLTAKSEHSDRGVVDYFQNAGIDPDGDAPQYNSEINQLRKLLFELKQVEGKRNVTATKLKQEAERILTAFQAITPDPQEAAMDAKLRRWSRKLVDDIIEKGDMQRAIEHLSCKDVTRLWISEFMETKGVKGFKARETLVRLLECSPAMRQAVMDVCIPPQLLQAAKDRSTVSPSASPSVSPRSSASSSTTPSSSTSSSAPPRTSADT